MADQRLIKFRELREKSLLGGGQSAIDKQHQSGKLTARERIDAFLDAGTFQELGALAQHTKVDFDMDKKKFPGDGVVTGFGEVEGRPVGVFAQDFTILGGSFSSVQAQKINKIQDLSLEAGIPCIGLNDSGGARVQEGVYSLAAYGEVFKRNVLASGVIPQISVIMGPCAGGAVYSPALTDFTVMVDGTSYMFLTGPGVVKSVTGEDVTQEELGGAAVHTQRSGVAHFRAADDNAAIELTRKILSYLPQNNNEDTPLVATTDSPTRVEEELNTIIPEDDNKAYDLVHLLDLVFDTGTVLQVQEEYARNAVVGFARLDGRAVGFVANNPGYMSGVLDIDSSDKISRFCRIADAYNLPIITFEDCPGYLPGTQQEYGGVIRHGAKIIYGYTEATVPKVCIVTRKGTGGAYVALSSIQMRADVVFAWPSAQIAVMGPAGAAPLVRGKEIKAAPDPKKALADFIEEYRENFFNPYRAADIGQVDEVIEPKDTRVRLIQILQVLQTKVQTSPNKKHGIFPS
ncbi:MAG: acyl-CoA carboxylase subunit beta [Propionibacteriaceae bacterium]|jgi:acetyl-CoA/propionyl-CoA carboxylase carboxyl transferase subunit|nr:acyl-CoA carboxylase subunit beta [Propionibacteriaceae bacterium]